MKKLLAAVGLFLLVGGTFGCSEAPSANDALEMDGGAATDAKPIATDAKTVVSMDTEPMCSYLGQVTLPVLGHCVENGICGISYYDPIHYPAGSADQKPVCCTGCWQPSTGTCLPGNTPTACGKNGSYCVNAGTACLNK